MSDSKVEITGETGTRNQWGKNLFYHSDGLKDTLRQRRLTWIVCTLFVVSSVLLAVLQPDLPVQQSKSQFADTQINSSNTDVSEIPPVPRSSGSGTRGTKSSGTLRILGPAVIGRTNKLEAPPGSLVKAVLLTGASNGPTRAQVTEALEVNGETLIPAGTILVGQGTSGQDRLTIRFLHAVFEDGRSQVIRAEACDASDETPGVKGSKLGGRAIKIAGAIGLGFIGGLSEGLQETDAENGVALRKPTMKNALLNGTSHAALEQSRELMSSVKDNAPIIQVKSGTPILVLFGGQ